MLDAQNHFGDCNFPKFEIWFEQTIAQVYKSIIPSTIEYLRQKLEIVAPLSTFPNPAEENKTSSLSKKR
jgi:hypothetical protein